MLISDFNLIGQNLYSVRKKLGMTQNEIAESAGLSDRTYADIERGNVNMRIGTFIQICNALHITPDDVLVDDSFPEINTPDELIGHLKHCTRKEQDTILQILAVYLNSINKI